MIPLHMYFFASPEGCEESVGGHAGIKVKKKTVGLQIKGCRGLCTVIGFFFSVSRTMTFSCSICLDI